MPILSTFDDKSRNNPFKKFPGSAPAPLLLMLPTLPLVDDDSDVIFCSKPSKTESLRPGGGGGIGGGGVVVVVTGGV